MTKPKKKLQMPKGSRIKKKKWWQSSRTEATKSSQGQSLPDASNLSNQPVKVLDKCSEVKMKQFKACMVYDDLRALVVSGEPTALELSEAWTKLFYEYCDLAEEAEVLFRTKLMVGLKLDKIKESLASEWIELLSRIHSDIICAAIREIGFDFELNPEDPAQYKSDITRIKAELAFLRLSIQVKEVQYEAVNKSSTSESVDEKYFATIYQALNAYAKYEAVNDQTSVEMYCAALRAYTGVHKTNNS
jgi:hypothetical protein